MSTKDLKEKGTLFLLEDWEMTEEGDEQTCFDLEFAFTRYERR